MIDVILFNKLSPKVGVAVSSTNTYYSEIFGSNDCTNWSVHLQWTGTPSGTLTLWASNKPDPDASSDSDWVSVTLPAGMAGPAGSASSNFTDVGNSGGKAYRLKYVNASGSGALMGWVHGKQAA